MQLWGPREVSFIPWSSCASFVPLAEENNSGAKAVNEKTHLTDQFSKFLLKFLAGGDVILSAPSPKVQ